MVRIAPADIKKKGKVPKNGSLFFTIFQTFMSGREGRQAVALFRRVSAGLLRLHRHRECHRGGANDESNWRGILDYFAPACSSA